MKPAAPEPPAPGNQAARGAQAPGSARYETPPNAVFVDGKSGNSTQSGSLQAPFRSVQAAVDRVPSGATIVIRGGEYHEEVTVPYNKRLTIQSYPGEAVWFDGSKSVTNWRKAGSVWISDNWTPTFSSNMMNGQTSWFVNPAHPMAAHPDQVFVNGAALAQVASTSQVRPGAFAVDYKAKQLIIGTDPSGKDVRASALEQALDVQSAGSVLRGFGVRRYGTPYDANGTVRIHNVDVVLRDLTIVDNATIGLSVGNDRASLERLTVQRNGQLGIAISQAYGSKLIDSTVTDNNKERFNEAPVAGGVKITRTRGLLISNVDTSRNNGMGTWLDESVYDAKLLDIISNDNPACGIQVELSSKVIIARSETLNNREGIRIFNSENVQIVSNELGNNSLHDLHLVQDERRQATQSYGRDPRVGRVDPSVTWITRNITVQNNVFGSGSPRTVFATDKKTGRHVDTWNVVFDGNLFTAPMKVMWGGSNSSTFQTYTTPETLGAAKGRNWRNALVTTPKRVNELGAEISENKAIAKPLPNEVAQALGLPAGTVLLGTGKR